MGAACAQVSKQVLQLRSQQALLRTAFEGELQRAAADCANGVEAMQARWRQVCADSPSQLREACPKLVAVCSALNHTATACQRAGSHRAPSREGELPRLLSRSCHEQARIQHAAKPTSIHKTLRFYPLCVDSL